MSKFCNIIVCIFSNEVPTFEELVGSLLQNKIENKENELEEPNKPFSKTAQKKRSIQREGEGIVGINIKIGD